jgi:hypothetical protein
MAMKIAGMEVSREQLQQAHGALQNLENAAAGESDPQRRTQLQEELSRQTALVAALDKQSVAADSVESPAGGQMPFFYNDPGFYRPNATEADFPTLNDGEKAYALANARQKPPEWNDPKFRT